MGEIAPWFLELLVCPVSKAPVVQVGDWLYSTHPATRRRYPIRDGVPNMLIEESEVVEPTVFERIMASVGVQRSGAEGAEGADRSSCRA